MNGPAPSVFFHQPLQLGAEWDGAATTRFRLWAPSVATVQVQIDDGALLPMTPLADGLFEAHVQCPPGTRYRFCLPDGSLVPDPAARAQCGDVQGHSVVVDPTAYLWTQGVWRGRPWHESVIYELHAGLAGGFGKALASLPALAALGITVVELMPVADFAGSRNWGYDGVLPFAPDESYGTPEELKAFVDGAHALGISVMLDVVYNHFGPVGNHLAQYAASFFKAEKQAEWGAAIDFTQTPVRQFYVDNALFWLNEYRFDGLRLDAVHVIKDASFLPELVARVRAAVEPGRHIHLVLENERNDAKLIDAQALSAVYDAQWNDDFHNALHVLLTGEREGYYGNYAVDPLAQLLRCLGEGFAYQGEPMPVNEGRPRGSVSRHLPPTAFVNFLQNHDQVGNRAMGERLTSLVQGPALHAAQALLLLSPGIPLLFMGEECDSQSPFLFFTDFHGEIADAVREGRQEEFAGFAAFADAKALAKIPDPNDEQSFRRSIPKANSKAESHAAKARLGKLLHIRHAELVPRLLGAYTINVERIGEKAFVARWRLGDGCVLRIACNLGEGAAERPPMIKVATLLYQSQCGAGMLWAQGELPAMTTIVELLGLP